MIKRIQNFAILILIVVALLPIVIFACLVLLPIFYVLDMPKRKKQKEFLLKYQIYLEKAEGRLVFCYTNKKKTESIIKNQIIPLLDESIEVVSLTGRERNIMNEKEYTVHSILSRGNIYYPFFMKYHNSKVEYISIRDDIYNVLNSKMTVESLIQKINSIKV